MRDDIVFYLYNTTATAMRRAALDLYECFVITAGFDFFFPSTFFPSVAVLDTYSHALETFGKRFGSSFPNKPHNRVPELPNDVGIIMCI